MNLLSLLFQRLTPTIYQNKKLSDRSIVLLKRPNIFLTCCYEIAIKTVTLTILLFSNMASATNICSTISGASVIANDGKYLGIVANEYHADSILNEYGTYGSEYSSDSIWNEYGSYGSEYSSNSPFNPYTLTPPVLVKNGKVIANLTVNENLEASVNPYFIKTCTFY